MGADETTRVLARVRLLALDVDGTLTDGRVTYVGEHESQSFDVHDGQGLTWLARAEVQVAWITGRGCEATERRAAELGVRELHLGASPKVEVLRKVQERLGIPPEETAAMGDDLPDLGLRERAAFFAAPANARPEVREVADLVARARGGEGAVRELAEAILRAKDLWPPPSSPGGATGAQPG
jgi:3-deoxy-D-manno-octulosonate 8-phosphate phosphatase (KDO 8-P phosphatase)